MSKLLFKLAAVLLSISTPAFADDQPLKNRFGGAYVAVSGGYDFATPGQLSSYSLAPIDNIKGGKLGGTGGYNVTSGRLLVGIESRAQYQFGEAAGVLDYGSPGITLPYYFGYCYGCAAGTYQPGYPITLSYNQHYSEKISRPFSGDLSLRAGLVFEDWLLYGRAGLGAEYNKRVTVNDQTGTKTCNNPTQTYVPSTRNPGAVDLTVTSCGSITSGTNITTTVTRITPIVSLAGGIERNFGAVFVRAEAELVLHYPGAGESSYYSPAGNVAVGYRF